jgi:hypothetical protein
LKASLSNEEPSLTFVATGVDSTTAKTISVKTAKTAGSAVEDELILTSASGSGKCFFLRHVNTAGLVDPTTAQSGSWMAETTTNTACSADDGVDSLDWKAL